MNWIDFWNSDHSLYVCDKHRQRHHERISADIIQRLQDRPGVVIDYGCGEALSAPQIAQQCNRLILSDGAPNVLQRVQERYQEASNIAVMSPEDVLALEAESIDCIIINSVLQYLPADDTEVLLGSLSKLLVPHGRIILGGIMPPSSYDTLRHGSLIVFCMAGAILNPCHDRLSSDIFIRLS